MCVDTLICLRFAFKGFGFTSGFWSTMTPTLEPAVAHQSIDLHQSPSLSHKSESYQRFIAQQVSCAQSAQINWTKLQS